MRLVATDSQTSHGAGGEADSASEAPINLGVWIMIVFQAVAIPIYLMCMDSVNRHYTNLANNYIPIGYFLVCAGIVHLRLAHSHLLFWTPITWFFVTCGMMFGWAPLIYFYGNPYSIRFLDSYYVIDESMLLRTNLLNAVGTMMVCLAHALAGYSRWRPRAPRVEMQDTVGFSKRMFWRLLWIALPLKWLVFVPMYLEMFDFAVPGVILYIANLLGACIALGFYIAFRGHTRYIWIAVLLMLGDAVIATITFSKASFILPVLQATMGIYLARRSRSVLIVGLLLAICGYMYIKPLVGLGRAEFSHKNKSTVGRVELVERYISGEIDQSETESQADSQHWWTRHSFSNIEGFMIHNYENGRPGETIRDFWVLFIPRIFWPDKPYISLVGSNLNNLIVGNDQTSIGGTVFGEAYWNGGWPMVIGVSIFIGIVLFVMGQLSTYYLEVMDLRYLPIAIMGIFYGLDFEDWFMLAFVGTLPVFLAIWYFIKFLFPVKAAR